MTNDLVKRLREYRIGCGIHCSHYESKEPLEECVQAADRIEALEKALREVISVSDRKTDIYERARAALEGKE